MLDIGDVYEMARRQLVADVRGCTVEELAARVPAAPEWSVHDVLAHVVGLTADLNAQRFPAPDDEGGTAWSAAQVSTRALRSIDELVEEWDREAPAFEEGIRLLGPAMGAHFTADLVAHLADVGQAVGRPAAIAPEAVAVSLDHYLAFVDEHLVAAGWGVLEVRSGATVHRLGPAGSVVRAAVSASPYDTMRTFSARRSEAQIRALRWEGDVDAAVAFLRQTYVGGYALPLTDLPPD